MDLSVDLELTDNWSFFPDITCDALHQGCRCSVTNACSLPNTECDPDTDSCRCNNNSIEVNGACVDINSEFNHFKTFLYWLWSAVTMRCLTEWILIFALSFRVTWVSHKGVTTSNCIAGVACDEADKPCYCDRKDSSACGSVPNSICNTDSGSCVCTHEFNNVAGTCQSKCCLKLASYHWNLCCWMTGFFHGTCIWCIICIIVIVHLHGSCIHKRACLLLILIPDSYMRRLVSIGID